MSQKSVQPKEVFIMLRLLDDPIFEGFGIKGRPKSQLGHGSVEDDMCPGYGVARKRTDWQQPRLAATWQPLKVEGRVAPFNDFPCVSLSFPAFSRRACEVLKDFLEPNGELLPLVYKPGLDFFFYNITTIADVLDLKKSDCLFNRQPPVYASLIHRYEFKKAALKGLSIFRFPHQPMEVMVTDAFVKRVRENGLNGFEFIKVWPLPPEVQWRAYHKEKTKAEKKRKGKGPTDHTLVIRLFHEGKKASAKEKKRIAALEDEIDAQLVVTSLEQPYFGSLEGDDFVPNEARLFISCPNADVLEQKLLPWLNGLEWPGQVAALKRYGPMRDVEAPEQEIKLERP